MNENGSYGVIREQGDMMDIAQTTPQENGVIQESIKQNEAEGVVTKNN